MSEEDDSIIDLTAASSDEEEAQRHIPKKRSALSHEHWLHSALCRHLETNSWPCRPPPKPVRGRGRTIGSQISKGTGATAPAATGAAAPRRGAGKQAAAAREQAALRLPDGAAGCEAGKTGAASGLAVDVQSASKAAGKPAATAQRQKPEACPPSAVPAAQHSADAPEGLVPDVSESLAKLRGRGAGGVPSVATSGITRAAATGEPAAASDTTAETAMPTTSQAGSAGSTLAHRKGGSQQPVAGEATAGKGTSARSTSREQPDGLFALLVENQATLPPEGHHEALHKPSSKQMRASSQDTAAAPSSSFGSLAGHRAVGGREKTPAADRQGPGTAGPPARGSHCHSQEPPVHSQGLSEAGARALSQARPRRQKSAGQVQGRAEAIALSKPSDKASPQTKSRAAPASAAWLAAVRQVQHQAAAQPEAVACTPKSAAAEKQSSKGAGGAAAPSSPILSPGEDFDVDIDLDPEAPGDSLLVPGGGCEA